MTSPVSSIGSDQHQEIPLNTPLFAYLMTAPGSHRRQTGTYIGLSSNPIRRLKCQNRELPAGAKSTRGCAPNWRLELVIGPFHRGGDQFVQSWRRNSRKPNGRLVHGVFKVSDRYPARVMAFVLKVCLLGA